MSVQTSIIVLPNTAPAQKSIIVLFTNKHLLFIAVNVIPFTNHGEFSAPLTGVTGFSSHPLVIGHFLSVPLPDPHSG